MRRLLLICLLLWLPFQGAWAAAGGGFCQGDCCATQHPLATGDGGSMDPADGGTDGACGSAEAACGAGCTCAQGSAPAALPHVPAWPGAWPGGAPRDPAAWHLAQTLPTRLLRPPQAQAV